MKQMIIDTLGLSAATQVAFSLAGITVGPLTFTPVKDALDSDKIGVAFSDRHGAEVAVYSYRHNRYTLGFRQTNSDANRESLLVHESLHAAMDIAAKPATVKNAEAAAYIAQCQFYYYRNQTAIDGGQAPTFRNATLRAAWPIAMAARSTPAITEDTLRPLYSALANDPLYHGRTDNTESYDGV